MVGAFRALSLDPNKEITSPSPIQCPMDPSYIENTNCVFAKHEPATLFFPNFLKRYLLEISG